MQTKNDGGAAFPFTGCGDEGMSLRDYFIVHAPSEPQEWFDPDIQPFIGDVFNRLEAKKWWQFWRNEMMEYLYSGYTKEYKEYISERDRQRSIQWPVAWADAMLAARKNRS